MEDKLKVNIYTFSFACNVVSRMILVTLLVYLQCVSVMDLAETVRY